VEAEESEEEGGDQTLPTAVAEAEEIIKERGDLSTPSCGMEAFG